MITRRDEWEEARRAGLARFLLHHGALRRGLPMALVAVLLIQAAEGGLDPGGLATPRVALRFLLAWAVFALGGALSAYAHWRALERRFGPGSPAGR